jgi:hypothetical protein
VRWPPSVATHQSQPYPIETLAEEPAGEVAAAT